MFPESEETKQLQSTTKIPPCFTADRALFSPCALVFLIQTHRHKKLQLWFNLVTALVYLYSCEQIGADLSSAFGPAVVYASLFSMHLTVETETSVSAVAKSCYMSVSSNYMFKHIQGAYYVLNPFLFSKFYDLFLISHHSVQVLELICLT